MIRRPFFFLLHETPGAPAGGSAAAPPAPGEAAAAPPAEQQGSGLYEQYMQNVPEELRGYVQDTFKEWDKGVTPKLQEAAQIREKLGAFADIEGIDQVPPEAVSGLVELHNMLANVESDPQPFMDWLQQANAAMGLQTGAEGLDEESWAAAGEANGWFEGTGEEGDGGGDAIDIEEHPLVQQLMQRLDAAEGKLTEQEQSSTVAQERQQLESRLSEVMSQFGEMEPDEAQALQGKIVNMAHAFADDDDPIGKAAEQIADLRGQTLGAAAERDLNQPAGALRGGRTNTAPEEFTGFDDPNLKAATLARVKQG